MKARQEGFFWPQRDRNRARTTGASDDQHAERGNSGLFGVRVYGSLWAFVTTKIRRNLFVVLHWSLAQEKEPQ
jgi:hypothetical protein